MPAIGFIKPFRRGGLRGDACEAGDGGDDDVDNAVVETLPGRGFVALSPCRRRGWTSRCDVAGKEHKGDV